MDSEQRVKNKLKYQKIVSDRMQECILREDVTNKIVAKKMGVSESTVSKMLQGESINTSNVIKFANAFQVSVDYLLGLCDRRVGHRLYSDVIFYLRYLLDNGYLGRGTIMVEDFQEDPTFGTEMHEMSEEVFMLYSEFADTVLQYGRLRRILYGDDSGTLAYWKQKIFDKMKGQDNIHNQSQVCSGRFNNLRKEQKITTSELQDLLGMDNESTIKKYYRDKSLIVLWDLVPLAERFCVSVDYLVGISNNYGTSVNEAEVLDLLIDLYDAGYLVCYAGDDRYGIDVLYSDAKLYVKDDRLDRFCRDYCSARQLGFADEMVRREIDQHGGEIILE